MKTDIVERLRSVEWARNAPEGVMLEAADTIESLRLELAAQTERADLAWRTTNIVEKARQECDAKLAAMTQERDEYKAQAEYFERTNQLQAQMLNVELTGAARHERE